MKEIYRLDALPLHVLSGIGPRFVDKFAKLGLKNLQDLLFHLPVRYEDRTKIFPMKKVLPGMKVTVQGKILNSEVILSKKNSLICRISDSSGVITLRFFYFNVLMKNSFSRGRCIRSYGEIRRSHFGNEMVHPKYHFITEYSQTSCSDSLTPIYPTTSGLRQTTLRNAIDQALNLLNVTSIPEVLPKELKSKLMSLTDALKILHRPSSGISCKDLVIGRHPAHHRLIVEELLAYNLTMLTARADLQKHQAFPLQSDDNLSKRFLSALPFSLTRSQQRVIKEIKKDLARNIPMMRLVQGDVGSGKTLIAAQAAICAISLGYQVALMVPTELLAEEHAQKFRDWFVPLGIEVICLSGKKTRKVRQAQQEAISNGRVSMVIGTHAIFQEQVSFSGLALVIIDEQHRFGVYQRLALWEKGMIKGFQPHRLIMTATPIPRTLAMAVYSGLDTSIIDEVPPNRIPVTTVIVPDTRRSEIIQRVRYTCLHEHRQVYWVCTMIEESNTLEAQAAIATWQALQNALPELQIGLVHGRMKPLEKRKLYLDFKSGKLALLVTTTVIEVGVDVPNSSLMIIENPERLGLSQLHQLRGRVGRGTVNSYCVLLYKKPLSKIARLRLQVLKHSNNGFFIAERDLAIRGPGDLFGTRQTGKIEFRAANLLRDKAIIPKIQRLAQYIYRHHPESARALIERWMSSIFPLNMLEE